MKEDYDVTAYKNKVLKKDLAVELEPQLMLVAEAQARANHQGWMEGKKAKGYVYGPVVNDNPENGPLTSPLLVPYDELSEEDKRSNIVNAVAVLKILKNKGCSFVNLRTMILYPIAKEIHDEWAREKFMQGWTWGPVTDKANKIHRDLVPFHVLLADPELRGDIEYDVTTAKNVLIGMIQNADVFPLISDLANFSASLATC